jgi:hypothetical protein
LVVRTRDRERRARRQEELVETDITLSIHLEEDEAQTVATTILNLRGDHFEAKGAARRNPTDPPRPVIGEELAIARALTRLEDQLTEAAWRKIEKFVG